MFDRPVEAQVTWTTPVGDQFTTWPVDHLGVRDRASGRASDRASDLAS